METRYTDELAAWADQKAEKKRRQDAAAVAFLAVKSDVIAATEAGYSLTTIYEHMHETGRVRTSYETFRRHVQRFINKVAPATQKTITVSASNSPAAVLTPTAPTTTSPASEPARKPAAKVPSFNFNPKPDPKDLL